jgi:hypothetical protein
VISKAGTMTGGVTREDDRKAGRCKTQDIDKLREDIEKLKDERTTLIDSVRDERLKNALSRLRSRDHCTKASLNSRKRI